MSIIAIIQARMGSTRLPGKVLSDLAGEPLLARVVNRTRRAQTLDQVLVATTTKPADEPIVRLCEVRGWPFFRGSEEDVLDRYYRAARDHVAEVVVRITSDCPLIEPAIIDWVVREFFEKGPLDYTSNTIPPRTFPRGLDVEVFTFAALERAWREDQNPAWREHVTPFLYRNPCKLRVHSVINPIDYSSMRWTVDTPEDLNFVRRIYECFGHDRFSWQEVLNLLIQHPDLGEINRDIPQKEVP
ncbi:MAG: glycosyltransferase family protein [Deltaproteobacteria bacterium]